MRRRESEPHDALQPGVRTQPDSRLTRGASVVQSDDSRWPILIAQIEHFTKSLQRSLDVFSGNVRTSTMKVRTSA
jgi:hypothetical protein